MALTRFSLNIVKTSFKFSPSSAIRISSNQLLKPSVSQPSRMFTTSKVLSKEQVEELQKNPFFDKYAEKIAKLQKTNPEEFLDRLEAKSAKSQPDKPKDFSLPGAAKPSARDEMGKQKTLDKVMNMSLLADKTAEEIANIWNEHFASKDAVAAVIPVGTYKVMQERFKEFNTFLFPLPRDMGYEFTVVQFMGHEAHFTTLINYQAHKENAPECLSMVHYTELAEEKGIVLMVGEYDKDVLNPKEAKCLADQVEIYYSRPSQAKLDLLNKFTSSPQYFTHADLISEMNNIEIEAVPAVPAEQTN
eukprot:GFUD01017301.1.p1 GENE.GFUD01017301.1~~GFUD01017301.1.p1  ORF type:complete len:303 (+),score=100.97 GFUD01017301.1:36-944(+)